MNLLRVLAEKGEWMSEQELCQVHRDTTALVLTLLSAFLRRGLVDCQVDDKGRAFKINRRGQIHLATARSNSVLPPPSCEPVHVA